MARLLSCTVMLTLQETLLQIFFLDYPLGLFRGYVIKTYVLIIMSFCLLTWASVTAE